MAVLFFGGPRWVPLSAGALPEDLAAGTKPVSGLAEAAAAGQPDSAAAVAAGRPAGEPPRPQSHRHGTRPRLLQLEETGRGGRQPTAGVDGPAFVELPAPLLVGKQALFELDNGAGATLRVQLVGYDAADLEALTRRFWDAE